MLLRDDGKKDSGSCSEDGENDALRFDHKNDDDSSNNEGDAESNDVPYDNKNTYIQKSRKASKASSSIPFHCYCKGAAA